MEFCEMSNYNINSSLPLLQKKLQLLHSLQIVHLDIKPDNIAFSSTLKEYIFIDFGLSRIIKEQLGSKTFTSFLGSLSYCYDEMVKLYLDETSGFVDLYYNDAFGLDKSLSYLKKL
jgi:serine/threonine protein kinase